MKIQATYFFSPHLVDTAEFECDIIPHSLAYFCSTCGEIWGRIECRGEGERDMWSVEICPCLHHSPQGVPDWSRYAGTVTDSFPTTRMLSKMWWGKAVEHLPPKVLRQEFDRLIQHLTKEST